MLTMDGGLRRMPLSLIEPTSVEGCLTITFKDFVDERGLFSEAYREDEFLAAGLPTYWAQDNLSMSHCNVMRGLHIQRVKPQGKLVRCYRGAIYDVCLDLRANSPTFMKWHAEIITGNKGLFLPAGTAHGFLALDKLNVVYYKCTSIYDAASDGGVNAYDPVALIPWDQMKTRDVSGPRLQSDKDLKLPTIKEWLTMGEPK